MTVEIMCTDLHDVWTKSVISGARVVKLLPTTTEVVGSNPPWCIRLCLASIQTQLAPVLMEGSRAEKVIYWTVGWEE